MAFQRSMIIAVCVSLCGCFLAYFFVRPSVDRGSNRGYGVLSLEQTCGDRTVGAALTAAGIETYFSESTQWVYLDDFGELITVPLDEYPERVEPFDPRNDGYAETLRSFFVRDGTRRFYIPLKPDKGDPRKTLAGQITAALGDTSYTLEFLAHKPAFSRYLVLFIVFGAAVLISLFFSETPYYMVFLIPPCLPLVFLGPAGLVLTGMLFGFSGSLLLLLRDLYAYRSNGMGFIRKQQGNHPEVFTLPRVMSLLFVLGYGAVVCLSKIPPLSALPALLSSCCAMGLVLKAESSRERHIRFRLVPIKKPALTLRVFCLYFRRHCPRTILPWAPAAVLVLFLPFILPESSTGSGPELEGIPVLSAEDYEAHVAFQRFFSLRPLDDTGKFKNYSEYFQYSGYYRYSMDKDGLVIETGPEEEGNTPQTALASIDFGDGEAFPFFPLAELMGFLNEYTLDEDFVRIPGDLLSILLILIPTVPSLWAHRRERRKGNALVINDKRIAA